MSDAFDFNDDLKREGDESLQTLLKEVIKKKYTLSDFRDVRRKKIPHQDYLASINGQPWAFEQKLDSYPGTGNVVIELLSYVKPNAFPFMENVSAKTKILDPGTKLFIEACDIVSKKPYGSEYGLGLTDSLKNNHIFCYIFEDKNTHIVDRLLMFNAVQLNQLIRNSYQEYTMLITRTRRMGREWLTVSSRISENELKAKGIKCWKEPVKCMNVKALS